jgi:hypothetical protein
VTALCITEISGLAYVGSQTVMAPIMPPIAEQSVTIGVDSARSKPISSRTKLVLLSTDSTCCLAFGTEPVAEIGIHRMAANEVRLYAVNAGDFIAVIASP